MEIRKARAVFLGNIGIVYIERIEFCRTIIAFYKKQLDTARLIPYEQADGRALGNKGPPML